VDDAVDLAASPMGSCGPVAVFGLGLDCHGAPTADYGVESVVLASKEENKWTPSSSFESRKKK
jgi:hypothetical protein